MTKGVLLFCFDTAEVQYHRILERCVNLIKKNLKLDITVVTNFETFKRLRIRGNVEYDFRMIDPERGNKKNGLEWLNIDRHMAYDLSPYDTTLVMDIDYLPFSDNLKKFMETKYDFLVSKDAYDLTGRDSFNMRRWSMIDMVWATVFIFRKGKRAKRIFDMVKYVKQYYHYFNEMYRIYGKNFRNDYAFAIALEQANGFINYDTLPIRLSTLPPDCKVVKFTDKGIVWQYKDHINYIEDQDVHVLNKEVANV